MFPYVKLALICVQLVQMFVKAAQDRKLINEGRAQVILENMTNATSELNRATEARQKVRDIIARDPAVVRKSDPFERPD
jgi:hypothetical protein